MGSIVTLGIERLEIDWGKNGLSRDHSPLFLTSDVSLIPYYYADDVVEMKEGLSRNLRSIKGRLDMLGYSLGSLEGRFNEELAYSQEYYPELNISFKHFRSVVKSINLDGVVLESGFGDYDLGEYVSKCIFEDNEIKKYLPKDMQIDRDTGTFFENLDPYITLRLLAENNQNLDRLVQWRYADVVEGGWVGRDEVVSPLPDVNKVLIVTEGSTDSFVLKRAIEKLYPDISDFFCFIDMGSNYPFTGTGNLYSFCLGLSKIKIQNNVLIVFDNDAAGVEKYNKAIKLPMPGNMHVCKLPDSDSFSRFETLGPGGKSLADINGSAVSIECFLDLNSVKESYRYIHWAGYNKELHRYQGEIIGKAALLRAFKKANLIEGVYDTKMLRYLLDYLINEWVSVRE